MEPRTQSPLTPAGAPLTSCDLDENCANLDCDAVMDEFAEALQESVDGRDFVAHYCGLDYMAKLRAGDDAEDGI